MKLNITAFDLIQQIQQSISSNLDLNCLEVDLKLDTRQDVGKLNFSIKKNRRSRGQITHTLIIWNKAENSEDISCPECGEVVIAGCSGYCYRCYIRFTKKGCLGI